MTDTFFHSCTFASQVNEEKEDHCTNVVMSPSEPRSTTSYFDRPSFFGEELFDDVQFAREMHDLSVNEREIVYDDVHGVAQPNPETPDFVNKCLQEMDLKLTKIPHSKRKWLDRAFFLKRDLQKDQDFKLMFLRADRYDATKAAGRMAAFFESKVGLFGEDKLVKKITLDDLGEETLKSGLSWRHVSNIKDRAGRRLVCALPGNIPAGWKQNTRFAWYQTMAALEDQDTQVNGVVYIVAASDLQTSPKNFIEMACLGGPFLHTLPSRFVGFHLCHNHPGFKAALAVTQFMVGKDIRVRSRTHFGSMLESQYALMTFGIPKAAIPILPDGTFDIDFQNLYLLERRHLEKDRKVKEEEACRRQTPSYIAYPNPEDVLVGRGRPFQEHSGNIFYLKIIDGKMEQYLKSDRNTRSGIFRDVINVIHERGGRFLQYSSREEYGGWMVVKESVAQKKVGHTFRHRPQLTSDACGIGGAGSSSTTSPNEFSAISICKRKRSDSMTEK